MVSSVMEAWWGLPKRYKNGTIHWEEAVLACVLAIVAILLIQRALVTYRWNKTYKLPPKVPGWPIVGNTFQIAPSEQASWALEQKKKYGEMFTVQLGVNNWVFLNSSRVVTDLMEKRSAIYSSRMHQPMASSIMSDGCRVLLMPYGDRWRAIRKVMHASLGKQNAKKFAPYQDLESKHLLYDYLHKPDKWYKANIRFANSVIMSVVFGKRMLLEDPDTMELLETSAEAIAAFDPGSNLVDALPFLEKLPKFLQWWRPRGLRALEKCKKVYRKQVQDLKARQAAGTARDCFASSFLADPAAHVFGENQTLFSLGSLIEAGSDTSRVAISQVLCAAIKEPGWVATAQAQLDLVCGYNAERLPTADDRGALKYMTAVVKEGLRWRPMVPMGFPTVLTKDDEYEGYRFPKGTVFTWNASGISWDENEYKDATSFKPERWLEEGVVQDLEKETKGHWQFGPGRRVCAGYSVGESNIWIVISRLLYCFDFNNIPGQEIHDVLSISWLGVNTAPFQLGIKVRSPQHEALIEREGGIAAATVY